MSGTNLEGVRDLFGKSLQNVDPANNDVPIFSTAVNAWIVGAGGGGGESNTSSNVGTGEGLALPKVVVDLPFKSLLGTTNEIDLVGNPNDVTFSINAALARLAVAQVWTALQSFGKDGVISFIRIIPSAGDPSTPTDGQVWYNLTTQKLRVRQNGINEDLVTAGAGEVNTSSNDGTGAGIAKTKVVFDLPFKSFLGTANEIDIANNVDDLTFSLDAIVARLNVIQTWTAEQTFVLPRFTGTLQTNSSINMTGGASSAILMGGAQITSDPSGSTNRFIHTTSIQVVDDVGSVPAYLLDMRRAGAALVTRPMFGIRNFGGAVLFSVLANGNVDLVSNELLNATIGATNTIQAGTGAELTANKNIASGYCPLDGSVFVPLANLSQIANGNLAVGVFGAITGIGSQTQTLNMAAFGIQMTSRATGDILKDDGSNLKRFARGGAEELLKVNSGGTDIEYGLLDNANVCSAAGILQSKLQSLVLANLPLGTAFQRYRTNSGATAIENFTEEAAFEFVIGDNSAVITTGIKLHLRVPFACEIVAATLLNFQSGSIVVDVNRFTSLSNFNADTKASITSSTPPTTSSARSSEDTTLTSWTVVLNQGDILEVEVDSVTTVERTTLVLRVEKRG